MLCFRQQSWNTGNHNRMSSLWNEWDSTWAYCDSRKEHLKSISDCDLFRKAETICTSHFVLFYFPWGLLHNEVQTMASLFSTALFPRLILPSRVIKQQLCSRSGGWIPGNLCLTKAWVGVNSTDLGSLLTSEQNIRPAECCLGLGFGAPCRNASQLADTAARFLDWTGTRK